MLSAPVTVNVLAQSGRHHVHWRVLAGVAAAVLALLRRQPRLVVFIAAVVVTALVRHL